MGLPTGGLMATDKPQPAIGGAPTFRITHRKRAGLARRTPFAVTSGGRDHGDDGDRTREANSGNDSADAGRIALQLSLRAATKVGSHPPAAPIATAGGILASGVEPNEQALSMDLPAGWQIQGGVIRPDSATGTRFSVTAVAPGNRSIVWLGDTNIPRMFIQPSRQIA